MEYLKQFEIFLQKAKTDFEVSKLLYESLDKNENVDIESVLFHLQQSCEKSLKAILSFEKIDFPKTHDLELLLAIYEKSDFCFDENYSILVDLSDYAVEGRYGMILDDIENINDYFEKAEKLLSFVLNHTKGKK